MTEQNPTGPTRPFESLDWYREATRSGSGGLGVAARLLDWARGIGFLSLHVSIYALGIVTMFVINLLRSPDRIWVDRAIPIWTLAVIIHAMLVGLFWAIGQLNRDDDGPLLVVSDAKWRNATTWAGSEPSPPTTVGAAPSAPSAPMARHTPPPAPRESGEETTMHFRPSHPAENQPQYPASSAPAGAPAGASAAASEWSGWESDVPQRIGPNDPDRASWQEAATAAQRGRTGTSSPPASSEADGAKSS